MRKFFTLISIALLSLTTLHATVVTSEIDLSSFSKDRDDSGFSWNTETLVVSTDDTNWPAIQLWSTIATTGYESLVLELAEKSTIALRLWVKYADDAEQYIDIPAGATVGKLNLADKSLKVIKITLEGAGSATLRKLYLCHLVGKEAITAIFEGTHTAATDWDHSYNERLTISPDKFNNIHDGDILSFTYTSDAGAACYAHITTTPEVNLSETNGNMNISSSQSSAATVQITIHESDVELLKSNGIYFEGINYTITNVSLNTYAQHVLVERTLNTGCEKVGWGGIWAHWDDIPTMYEGDELRVTVVAKEGSDNQIYFRYDWDHDALTMDETVDGTTPKIYHRTLTAADAEAINATHDLLITGTGLTVSRLAIAQSMSIYDDNMLWRGETAVTSWANPVSVSADKFANLTVGDVINVSLSSVNDGGQLWITKSDATPFTPKPHYIFNSNYVAPLTISCVINQDMLNDLQASGMLICGADFTITSVHVIEAAARVESYTLTVTEAGMATLVLPFNVPYLPVGVEAYSLTNDGSDEIEATQVNAIEADKPVLILASAGDYIFYSEQGANTDISGKYAADQNNYTNGAMVGNYFDITVPTTNPQVYNYILQNGAEGVGFYKVTANDCTLAPYRAYLSCGYNAMGVGAPMRIRFHQDTATGVENAQAATDVQKLLIDGQLYILRDGVTYTIQGQIVK